MDTTKPPFNDPRARRAFAMAVDRARVLDLVGGQRAGRPTCQLLPPGLLGYRSYCPQSESDSSGSRAAVATARRLVDASRTNGASVTWAAGVLDQTDLRPVGNYLARVLRAIGYRPHRIASGARSILSFYSWTADYPAPSDFFQPLFSCPAHGTSTNITTGFCDPALSGLIRHALAVQSRDPAAAAKRWASIDRRLTDETATLPLYNPNEIDFVASRVGNFRTNPQLGPLIDQMWVR